MPGVWQRWLAGATDTQQSLFRALGTLGLDAIIGYWNKEVAVCLPSGHLARTQRVS